MNDVTGIRFRANEQRTVSVGRMWRSGIPESRNTGIPKGEREEKYCGDTITAKWTYVMNQNTISGNGRRWDVGILFRRNRQSYAD